MKNSNQPTKQAKQKTKHQVLRLSLPETTRHDGPAHWLSAHSMTGSALALSTLHDEPAHWLSAHIMTDSTLALSTLHDGQHTGSPAHFFHKTPRLDNLGATTAKDGSCLANTKCRVPGSLCFNRITVPQCSPGTCILQDVVIM